MTDDQQPKAASATPAPNQSPGSLFGDLRSSPEGLTSAEAKKRLAESGYNELPEKKRNPLVEFFSHFWGPIPWMIEAAATLSALVHHWADLIIILVLLLANAIVGFWRNSRPAMPSPRSRPIWPSKPG